MALNPKTPGVYIQEVSIFPPSIAAVATAIPAFIGYTAIDPGEPVRITSMVDYEASFGGPHTRVSAATTTGALTTATAQYSMYYALQMYYMNGGGPCYVISTGVYKAGSPFAAAADFGTTWNGGALGKLALEDEPTLIVIPDSRLLATEAEAYTLYKAALEQCSRLQDRFVIMDLYEDDIAHVTDFRTGIGNQYLKYGAAYFPDLVSTLSYPDSAIVFSGGTLAGKTLADALIEADSNPAVANALAAVVGDSTVLKNVRDGIAALQINLVPSSAVAGIYAATDRNRGVWKAPANVSVNGVLKPSITITHEEQEDLNLPTNGKAVNAIRAFTGNGILVWGARTLAGNDNEWRYVPVRRLFIFVEESIKKATEFVVFEPNDANTWLRVKTMIENFLNGLWKDGALAGATPRDAFFVKCGLNETMTADDILNGKLIVEIGMAAVRPAEFIILKFSHKLQES